MLRKITKMLAKIKFLRSDNGCTRLDEIKDENICKQPYIYSMNGRTDDHTKKWLNHIKRMDDEGLPKPTLRYKSE